MNGVLSLGSVVVLVSSRRPSRANADIQSLRVRVLPQLFCLFRSPYSLRNIFRSLYEHR